jgi:hypothetical protein
MGGFRKQFRPNSRWVRYDKITDLWIPTRKRLILYWYKFLQHAELSDDYEVDWSKYDGWGGRESVLNTKFDDWWKQNWAELFGYGINSRARYQLSTRHPKADAIRFALLVYENRHKGSKWQIAKEIQRQELSKRNGVPSFYYATDGVDYGKEDKMIIQSKVGLFHRNAEQILEHVCSGVFP